MLILSNTQQRYGRSTEVSTMDAIFNELGSRMSQRLSSNKIHFKWEAALPLTNILKNTKTLYGVPVQIHRQGDPDVQFDWWIE